MISFAQWVNLDENYVEFDPHYLLQKFNHFNSTLFANKIPPCPIVWANMVGENGRTYYKSRSRSYIPGTLHIEINNRFKRTQADVDALIVHEMIHAYLAVTQGDGDGGHGFRFQSWVHVCREKTGLNIGMATDTMHRNDMELADNTKTLATCVLRKLKGYWYGNFYSATAFDTPAKMDALVAYWGAPGQWTSGEEEMIVVKAHTSAAMKYGTSRSIDQAKSVRLNPAEEQDIVHNGQIIKRIEKDSVSAADALNRQPTSDVLVVLQTSKFNQTVYATFYAMSVARDPARMHRLLEKWKGYHDAGRSVEIFTTQTTLLNRGYKTFRDETKGQYYILKPELVAELRIRAKYIVQWM